jgi:2-hydroxychromene-2-carboxylate isomerase
MTDLLSPQTDAPEIPGGPYDLEFFLDPVCPFAWQTSVWVRRVAELRSLDIGWRFISLYVIHEHDEGGSPAMAAARERGLQLHRVLDAVRNAHGNASVGRLYEAWGKQLWYGDPRTSPPDVAQTIDFAALLTAEGVPAELADAATDDSHDAVIRAETALAFERAGDDLGTPIITWNPPHGRSFFGPVISTIPSDDDALTLYDTLHTLAEFPGFAELKRSKRPALDLPVLRR